MDRATRHGRDLRMKRIVRQETAFGSMEEMMDAGGNYRPTIECSEFIRYLMAEDYDRLQAERGDDRRAHRYVNEAMRQSDVNRQHEIGAVMNVNQYTADDFMTVWVNQAPRDANVLAVIDDQILIEYAMPAGTSALLQYTIVGGRRRKMRNVNYNTCPKRWINAIHAAGNDWLGCGQRMATALPLPEEKRA